jgi:D-glycero-D-manno-heptose 1,7-bisphosphate phosphatase
MKRLKKRAEIMKKRAVFVDRDGTINEQMGYINHLKRFIILPGVSDAIRLLNQHNYLVIVVSNQSGVARGYFPIDLVHEIHEFMLREMAKAGAIIHGVFFCPHYPGGEVKKYAIECNCRKPRPGLIEMACREFDIDISCSYMVGDRYTDIELADRCNLKGIMVKTGYGMGDIEYVLPFKDLHPVYIADDLLDAVRWITSQEGCNGK